MSLSFTDILVCMRRESCVAWMRIPMKHRRRTAAREETDLSLIVHPTVKVLSQKRAAWVFAWVDVRYYSTIQLRTSPERSISLMVRVTALNSSFTLCGHSSCQMIEPILFRPYF